MTTFEQIRAMVAEQLNRPIEEVKPTSDLYDDLNGDDLDRIDLIFAIEAAFHVDVSDEQMLNVRTVADLCALAGARSAEDLVALAGCTGLHSSDDGSA